MTNKEKILQLLESISDTTKMSDILFKLSSILLTDEEFILFSEKIMQLANKKFFALYSKNIAYEQQLIQTKMYLKGEMYNNTKIAKEMLPKQIENIEGVINAKYRNN